MNPDAPENRLILFVKAPRPGFVKTRLAAVVGDRTAAETYEALVETLLARLNQLDGIELKYAPADARDEILPWLRPGWTASPQCEGDLTDRLVTAFAEAFASGCDSVVIIGSDCPYISPDDVKQAFRDLKRHDLVLGPAVDGGYWLIGLNQPRPSLFQDIPWSSETVLSETLSKAAAAGLSVRQLRELSDVDTVADLIRFNDWHRAGGGI
jgi:rSAM/selenodomain-associated transferase 1